MFNKIVVRLDQMENKIQSIDGRVEGSVIVGGTGEDGRGSQVEASSSNNHL
jgi:hypothetical protein